MTAITTILLSFLTIGCTLSANRKNSDSGIDRARYDELRYLAEKKLECSRNKLRYEYLGDRIHLLSGCGREVRYLIFSYNDVWVKIESFHKRASFELKCNIQKLTLVRMNEDTWEVFGCDRSARYVLKCEKEMRKCQWSSDTEYIGDDT